MYWESIALWRYHVPDEELLLLLKLSRFLSKEADRETVQKDAFQKGSSHTEPVSDEEREAMQETGTPGNCCPVLTRCHQSESLCARRLFPRRPLLRIMSAAKPGSVSAEKVLSEKPGAARWGRLSSLVCGGDCQQRARDAPRHLWTWLEIAHLPPYPVPRNFGPCPFGKEAMWTMLSRWWEMWLLIECTSLNTRIPELAVTP